MGQVNEQYLKAARFQGAFVWHAHEEEDELFYLIKGSFRMEFGEYDVTVGKGALLAVPKGVRHRPLADKECWALLVETVTTQHTGDVETALTRGIEEQLS